MRRSIVKGNTSLYYTAFVPFGTAFESQADIQKLFFCVANGY